MDRVAVFVDAGYLFAQGSVELHGEKLTRGELVLDHEAVVAKLQAIASRTGNLPAGVSDLKTAERATESSPAPHPVTHGRGSR